MATEFSNIERGQKELRTDWPHVEGTEFGETKTHDRTVNLVAEEGSKVLSRNTVLL